MTEYKFKTNVMLSVASANQIITVSKMNIRIAIKRPFDPTMTFVVQLVKSKIKQARITKSERGFSSVSLSHV